MYFEFELYSVFTYNLVFSKYSNNKVKTHFFYSKNNSVRPTVLLYGSSERRLIIPVDFQDFAGVENVIVAVEESFIDVSHGGIQAQNFLMLHYAFATDCHAVLQDVTRLVQIQGVAFDGIRVVDVHEVGVALGSLQGAACHRDFVELSEQSVEFVQHHPVQLVDDGRSSFEIHACLK